MRTPDKQIEQLALGGLGFACARYRSGRVRCAGEDSRGQLGNASVLLPGELGQPYGPVHEPTDVALTDVHEIALGAVHACALHGPGLVSCWGRGQLGQTGNGKGGDNHVTTPTLVSLPEAISIAAAETATCAVTKDGAVMCWGEGYDSPTGGRGVPIDQGIRNAKSVAIAWSSGCAVLRDGRVRCWTSSGVGAPIAGLQDVDEVAVSAFAATCARSAGRVSCWGTRDAKKPSPLFGAVDDAIALRAGNFQVCLLHRTGRVTCHGGTSPADAGKLGDVTGVDAMRLVAVEYTSMCGVGATDGNVSCWVKGDLQSQWAALRL